MYFAISPGEPDRTLKINFVPRHSMFINHVFMIIMIFVNLVCPKLAASNYEITLFLYMVAGHYDSFSCVR